MAFFDKIMGKLGLQEDEPVPQKQDLARTGKFILERFGTYCISLKYKVLFTFVSIKLIQNP